MSDIIPAVTVNDPSAAAANVVALRDALAALREQGGGLVLPPGTICVNQPIRLSAIEAELTWEGGGRKAGGPSAAPTTGPVTGMI
jgi:hypothetical protein